MIPVPVIPSVLSERAIPKSMIRAFPSLSIMMFAGLRSRWTTPNLCASDNPPQTCLPILMMVSVSSLPTLRIRFFRSSPGTYSMVM